MAIKKISTAFNSPEEGGGTDIREIRARNAIKRITGNTFLWLFYSFNSEYGRKPVDLDDLIDGLKCIRAKNKIQDIYGE